MQACLEALANGQPIGCVYNPVTGREREWSALLPAPVARRVVVVGGGPGGLEAARVTALRGHRVTLLEASERLGGQLHLAARLPLRVATISTERLRFQARRMKPFSCRFVRCLWTVASEDRPKRRPISSRLGA